jgi:hypothetical protein
MNKTAIFLVLLLLPVLSSGENEQVMVLDLHMEEGNVTLSNYSIQYGFYPDRRYQPDYGYELEIHSAEEMLYDFTFKDPSHVYREGGDEDGHLHGGLVVLDEVDFALTVPYHPEMEEVLIYNPEGVESGRFDFSEEEFFDQWWLVGGIVFVFFLLFLFSRKRR